jgi:hypothetical protein
MLGATDGLLVPVGLVTFHVFPVLAGLGFNFAPDWAWPAVVVVFYGSMLASAAAMLTGVVVVLRSLIRTHPRALAIAAGCLGLLTLALAAVTVALTTPSSATRQASRAPVKAMNMGPVINTGHREAEPSFTADGRTMYFNCNDYDICVSRLTGSWEAGQWTPPQRLGPPISTDYVEVEPDINAAGDKLYFNSSRPFGRGESLPGLSMHVNVIGQIGMGLGTNAFSGLGESEVWVSYLTDGVWSEPRNLNDVVGEPPVNTEYAAFWTSTRPGGFGGNDIWTSRRVGGKWTPAENLGPNVNGPGSDHHSIPTSDGRSLYVTSDRAGGLGGEDTYITTRGADGKWGPLVNLGPPVNGPANDRCPAWTPDGRVFLFDSDRAGGFGSKDLWWVYFKDVKDMSGVTRSRR